jgi:excisionase family DNA binding protein
MRHPAGRLLTVNEAAERMRTSRATVYRRIATGEIPAVRLGGTRAALRIPADALDAWLFAEPEAVDRGV